MIRLTREAWGDEAAEVLAPAMEEDAEVISDEVRRGAAQLYRVEGYGYVVVRVEVRGRGPELVLIVGAGRGFNEVLPVFIDMAKKQGIRAIRAHVQRRGMVRMYQRHGFEVDETVMRRSVS